MVHSKSHRARYDLVLEVRQHYHLPKFRTGNRLEQGCGTVNIAGPKNEPNWLKETPRKFLLHSDPPSLYSLSLYSGSCFAVGGDTSQPGPLSFLVAPPVGLLKNNPY